MENIPLLPELHEAVPTFLDYKIKSPSIIGARKKDLIPGDLVTDQFGIIGIVRFQSDKFGALIEFVDGLEIYESQIKGIRKLTTTNVALFNWHQRYFGFITRLGRVMLLSIERDYPHSNMFNNGRDLFVRASTLKGVTTRFVAQRIGKNHNFFSAILSPFFNCHIQNFDVKTSLRKSRFAYNVLRDLFIDIDLQMPSANRIKFTISEAHDYNDRHWDLITRQFAKFKLRRPEADKRRKG